MNERRCVHTWIIEPPDGPLSRGSCISCGQNKDFPNVIGEDDFKSWGRGKDEPARELATIA